MFLLNDWGLPKIKKILYKHFKARLFCLQASDVIFFHNKNNNPNLKIHKIPIDSISDLLNTVNSAWILLLTKLYLLELIAPVWLNIQHFSLPTLQIKRHITSLINKKNLFLLCFWISTKSQREGRFLQFGISLLIDAIFCSSYWNSYKNKTEPQAPTVIAMLLKQSHNSDF